MGIFLSQLQYWIDRSVSHIGIEGVESWYMLNLPQNENLVVWDRFRGQPAPRPDDPFLEAFVTRCVLETGRRPRIILDSWARLLKSGEGGEFTGQIAPLYLQLRKLVDLGATVSVLDHTRKYEKGTIYGGLDKEAKADSIHKLLLCKSKPQSENVTVRVESWLKRHAPEGEGSFAFEVQSTRDANGNWHIANIVATADPAVEERQHKINILRRLIKLHAHASQYEPAKLAATEGLQRDLAIKPAAGRDDWLIDRAIAFDKVLGSLVKKFKEE